MLHRNTNRVLRERIGNLEDPQHVDFVQRVVGQPADVKARQPHLARLTRCWHRQERPLSSWNRWVRWTTTPSSCRDEAQV